MAKYNVGVGDAFPVDADNRSDSRGDTREERSEDRLDGSDRRAACRSRYRGGARWIFFRIAALLGLIYLALHIVNGHGPRGLLVAAGIMVALGVFRLIFWRSDAGWRERREEERRRWREERRRYWGDR